jgi:iron complex outermembrane receptor protein
MGSRNLFVLLGGVSVLGLAVPIPVLAQQSQPGQADAANASGLEEVVVTARRRDEKLQSVPISVTALNAETLKERSINNLESLGSAVPSLTAYAESRDEEAIIIRGQSGSGASAQGQEPSVTEYFAQVPFPVGDGAGPGRFYDLENLQVLKGPQGTLFGRNSTGGAILFEPKRPTNNFEGYVQFSVGNYGYKEIEAAVNVPIVEDKLLIRVAGDRAVRDGFTNLVANGKDLDNRDYWSGRVGITFRPSDDFENYLVYDSFYSDNNGTSEILRGANPAFLGATADQLTTTQQALGIREEPSDITNPIDKIYSWGITDIARFDLSDNFTIKNIAGYREFKQLQRWDLDGTPLPLIQFETPNGWSTYIAQYTEEPQIQGKALGGKLDWTVGGFLLFAHPGGYVADNEVQFFAPIDQSIHPTERSQAVYGQATYDLSDFIDGLKFTGGYRYTWDYRGLDTKETRAGVCGFTDLQGNPTCGVSVSSRSSAPSWTLGLDYQILPQTLVYVTARRGYRSGGVNTQAFSAAQLIFNDEKVEDEEIGVKSDWDIAGMHARTNVAAYHTDYSGVQASETTSSIVNGLQETVNLIGNFGTASINGVEFDGTLIPFDGFELTANWAYTSAKFDSFIQVATGENDVGRPFPFVPQNKFSVTAKYTLPLDADLGKVSVQGTWSHSSHLYLATTPGLFEPVTAYDQFDFRIDWANVLGNSVDAGLFMTNAFNSNYRVGGIPIYPTAGFSTYVWSEPQMFGAQLKYRFGGPAPEPEAAPEAYTPPPPVAPAPVAHSYMVFFDFNKSDLTPQAVGIVDQAAHNAGPAKVTKLEVTGHTDTVGSDAYNMRLSRRRAESVAAELEKDGIPSSEIEIVAKGKRDLLVPTADGVKEPQNRRVQIVYEDGATS